MFENLEYNYSIDSISGDKTDAQDCQPKTFNETRHITGNLYYSYTLDEDNQPRDGVLCIGNNQKGDINHILDFKTILKSAKEQDGKELVFTHKINENTGDNEEFCANLVKYKDWRVVTHLTGNLYYAYHYPDKGSVYVGEYRTKLTDEERKDKRQKERVSELAKEGSDNEESELIFYELIDKKNGELIPIMFLPPAKEFDEITHINGNVYFARYDYYYIYGEFFLGEYT